MESLSQRQRIILYEEGSIVLPIRAVAATNSHNSNSNNPITDETAAASASASAAIRSLRIHRLVLRPVFVTIFIFTLLSILNTEQGKRGGSFIRHHSKSYYSSKQNLHPPLLWTRNIPKTTKDDDEEGGDNNNNSDPQTLGWTPNMYPDPKIEPHKCGIAYLVETNSYYFQQASSSSSNLRLCDPDWVLGGVYLDQISISMADFRRQFSSYYNNNNFSGDDFLQQQQQQQQAESYGQFFSVEEESTANTAKDDDDYTKELLNNDKKGTVVVNNNNDNSGDMAVVEEEGAQDDTSFVIDEPVVELAVATVRKMNVHAVLEQGSYYSYEDEDDMVNDAAQIFARYLHGQWWGEQQDNNSNNNNNNNNSSTGGENGILIFLSIQDRVCFISTGSAISTVLPWWRLEHIVSSMKPDLRHRDYGHALLTAIGDLSEMLREGPPTMADKVHDFMSRFGVVIAFAMFTFFFGAWGELRERRKRWQYAETRSKLTPFEREKARLLQREFKSRSCPICLENFDYGEDLFLGEEVEEIGGTVTTTTITTTTSSQSSSSLMSSTNSSSLGRNSSDNLKRVDSYGIPLCGGDRKTIKLLRCGHIFCNSCWMSWVHSGHGNPCICPVCRQDIGKSSSKNNNNNRRRRRNQQEPSSSSSSSSLRATTAATTTTEDYDATPLISNAATSRSRRDGDGVTNYSYDAMGEWIGRHSSSSSSTYDVMGVVTSSHLQSTEEEEDDDEITGIGGEEEGYQYHSGTAIQMSLSEPREAHGYYGLGQSPPSQLQQQLQQRQEEGQQEEDREETMDETISLLSNDMRRRGWFSR